MYEKTLSGLALCYAMAVPFFHYTVMGDLIWSGVIFGSYYLVKNYSIVHINRSNSLLFSNN